MSPKWILRHRLATSSLEELAHGSFATVIADSAQDAARVRRVVLCSGKVYYHLYEEREKRNLEEIALVRIEQLYPFDEAGLEEALRRYSHCEDVLWCQEEPMNQGVWYNLQHHMRAALARIDDKIYLRYVGREASASPATGHLSSHLEEQQRFIDQALEPLP